VRHPRVAALLFGLWGLGVCAAAAGAAGPDGSWHWRQAGYSGGGRFTAAVVDPASPETVYVGSDVAGFFRSRDGATTFTPLGRDLTGFAVADILPTAGAGLLILTDDGLYVSRDQGDTQRRVSDVRYQNREPGSHLLLAGPDGIFYVATDTEGVFRLEPTEGNWVSLPLGLSGTKVNSLALAGEQLYAATDQGVARLSGGDFEPWDRGLPTRADVTDMAYQGGRLYCLVKDQGVYALAGDFWQFRGPNPALVPGLGRTAYKNFGTDPSRPGSLFLATHPKSWPHRLLVSLDAGLQWQLVTRFEPDKQSPDWGRGQDATERITFSPDGRLGLLTDWWRLWRSRDGGGSWQECRGGLQNTVVNAVVVHPDDPKRLFLAASDNGLMVSADGGATWRRSMAGVEEGDARAVALAPGRPDTVYLLMTPWKPGHTADTAFFYLYRSDDGGATWRRFRFHDQRKTLTVAHASGLPCALAVSQAQPDQVFVAISGYGIYALDTTQAPADGQDAPARNVATGLDTPYFAGSGALLLVPGNPETLYAATLEGGIWRTRDGGTTWESLPATRGFVFALAVDPGDPKHFLAAAARKTVLETRDGGATWTTHPLPGARPDQVPAACVAFGPAGSGLAAVGTTAYNNQAADGLFVSRDGGKTFAPAASAQPRIGINALAANPVQPGAVYVGFNGLGLYAAEPEK